ncbi:hypothetical protein [Streptomyces sp. NPDC051561]|uniref:hypothetical protein n=1 Tax=Streptomyces sp. NPDC051561 TaxID=3365658 RepID=UPI0037B19E9D
MRKAYTLSAIAVAATLAMAGPATAFASESAAPPAASGADTSSSDTTSTGTSSTDQGASDKAEAPVVSVSSSPRDASGYAAGEVVEFQVTAPSSAKVSASSDALQNISLTQVSTGDGHTVHRGTGTVKAGFGIGTAHLSATADFGDTGSQGTTSFSVNTDPRPTPTPPVPVPSKASMSLSTDGGKPGDKVAVTIRSGNLKGNATVKSGAFTGTVNLERDPQHEGTWHGRATVSSHTASGYYAVDGYVGTTKFDTAKFGVAAGDAANHNSAKQHTAKQHTAKHTHHVKPLQPQQYKVPKGSVQTGMAPASDGGPSAGLIGAGALLGVGALTGTIALRRRHSNG